MKTLSEDQNILLFFCGVGNELVSPQGEPQVGLNVGLNVGLDNNDIISADNGFNWRAGPGIITTSHYCN